MYTLVFSALGAKSVFQSIEECYEDLVPRIFAVETGLSSDPPMNWMVSSLDKTTLLSNSDAHSLERIALGHSRYPGKLEESRQRIFSFNLKK